MTRAASSDDGDGKDDNVKKTAQMKKKKERKPTGELLSNLWAELKRSTTPLREDEIPEAVELLATLEAAKARPSAGETWSDERWKVQESAAEGIGEAVSKYWGAKWENLVNSDAVKEAAPLVTGAVNVAIAGVLLRLAVPRLAALNAVGGFDELADFFGLPPRDELSGYLEQLQGYPTLAVFAVYVGLFAAEKLTMTDEFLPIGFILPVVSPAVFGGVLGGTVLTSLASTMAASLNFFLGRTVLREKALALQWKDNPPVGESKWFKALSRRFDSAEFPESEFPLTEGFKSALLLRLCPILPIPLSGNWYVCGMTPLRFPEFFAAHFIGSSKTAFVDAYLGSLLLQAAFESEQMKEQAQSVLVFETAALVIISIGVTTYATDLFTQILEEEGIDADSMMSLDEDDEEEEDARKDVWKKEEVAGGKDEFDKKIQSVLDEYEAKMDTLGGVGGVGGGAVGNDDRNGGGSGVSDREESAEESEAAKWAAEAFTPYTPETKDTSAMAAAAEAASKAAEAAAAEATAAAAAAAAAAAIATEAEAESAAAKARRAEAELRMEIDRQRVESLLSKSEQLAKELAEGDEERSSLLNEVTESEETQKEVESMGTSTANDAPDFSKQEQAVLDAMDAAAAKALAARKERRKSSEDGEK